jgi:hypothetical protein
MTATATLNANVGTLVNGSFSIPVGETDSAASIAKFLGSAGFNVSATSLRRLFSDAPGTERCGFSFKPQSTRPDMSNILGTKRGSKNARVLELMCSGATMAELGTAMGWSPTGACATAYLHTKALGYTVLKEKVEGRGVVLTLAVGDTPVLPSEIVYKK